MKNYSRFIVGLSITLLITSSLAGCFQINETEMDTRCYGGDDAIFEFVFSANDGISVGEYRH